MTRTIVATKRPPPSSSPLAMPHARALSRSNACATCWSCSFIGASLGVSDVVEEIAGLVQRRPLASDEDPRGDEQVAAEGGEPAANESDKESPGCPNDSAAPRQVVPIEVLSQQLQVQSGIGRSHQVDRGDTEN